MNLLAKEHVVSLEKTTFRADNIKNTKHSVLRNEVGSIIETRRFKKDDHFVDRYVYIFNVQDLNDSFYVIPLY